MDPGVGRIGLGAGAGEGKERVGPRTSRTDLPDVDQRCGFPIGQRQIARGGRGQEGKDLAEKRGDRQLTELPGEQVGDPAGEADQLLMPAGRGLMTGDLDEIIEPAPAGLEPVQPHRFSPPMPPGEPVTLVGFQRGGDPRMHDLLAAVGGQQRQIHQPSRRPPHHGPPGVGRVALPPAAGQVLDGQRQGGHRRLQQQLLLFAVEQAHKRGQQDVTGPEQHHVGDGLMQIPGGGQINMLLGGQRPQPAGHLGQAPAGTVAQQCVHELDQPRMPADRRGEQPPVGGAHPGQRTQPQQQPAQLGGAERRHTHREQIAVRIGDRIAAGHQESTGTARRAQTIEDFRETRIEETFPAGREVLFEVVEHDQQPGLGQQPPDRLHLGGVFHPPVHQLRVHGGQFRAAGDRLRHLADQPLRVPRPAVDRGQPALIGQPGQHPAGDRGLPDPADPGQHHPGQLHPGPFPQPQYRHGRAQLGPPADQLPDPQRPHRPTRRRGRCTTQRHRRDGRVE